MTQKAKGKSHPFAGHLRPNEEVLWMSQPPPHARQAMMGMGRTYLGFALGSIIGGAVIALVSQEILWIAFFFAMGSGIFIIVLALPTLIMSLLNWGRKTPILHYGVTNERLLCLKGDDLLSIDLDALKTVAVLPALQTLYFGDLFPIWKDLDDATAVKHLIDDARQQHQKELGR